MVPGAAWPERRGRHDPGPVQPDAGALRWLGVLGSAVGMDKQAMKAAFAAAGLPQVPYACVEAAELEGLSPNAPSC